MSRLTEFVLPDVGVHYWFGGRKDRPTVVLLHGATMDHRMFDAQVDILAENYQVLMWDARGHGQSQPLVQPFTLQNCAKDLVALLDHLGIEQVVLVGQSMGGYIAQLVYLHHPQRVCAMVMLGSVSISMPYSRWEIAALKASMPLLRLWPYEHFASTVAKSVAIRPEIQAYALEAIKQIDRKDFLVIWKAITLAISEKGIPGHHIQVPLLITHGARDDRGSIRKQVPTWVASEPHAQYVVIPDAGHNANQDNSAFFNRVLLEFLLREVGDDVCYSN
jgi:3-oxoadipate enol-lactonase